MSELKGSKLKYFNMAKLIKEGKVLLSKKDLQLFVKCIKELTDPRFQGMVDPRTDLRTDITGTGGSGIVPQEPMSLENQEDKRVDTKGIPIDPHYLDEKESRDADFINKVISMNEEGEDTNINVDINPIAKTFKQQGNFEQYIEKFSGLEIKQKEMESISNYSNAKPTKMEKTKSHETGEDVVVSVRYENSDDFNNNTITVIKKLREGTDLVFTAFQVTSQQTPESGEESTPTENEIVVNKSRSFRDDIEGGKILADLLQKLDV